MTRFISNTQLAEMVNVLWAIGFASLLFICAHLLRSAARKAKRLIHPPGQWRLPRRGGDAGSAVAPNSFHWRGAQHRDHVHVSTRLVYLPPDYPTWDWPARKS